MVDDVFFTNLRKKKNKFMRNMFVCSLNIMPLSSSISFQYILINFYIPIQKLSQEYDFTHEEGAVELEKQRVSAMVLPSNPSRTSFISKVSI